MHLPKLFRRKSSIAEPKQEAHEPEKPICCKVCADCCVQGKVRCCLNCGFLDSLIFFPSYDGIAADDWSGRMHAPVDSCEFWCDRDFALCTEKAKAMTAEEKARVGLPAVKKHRHKLSELPLTACEHWRPRFAVNSVTGKIEQVWYPPTG